MQALEANAWSKGQPVTNGKPWKVMDIGKVVGASEGKTSQWIRVEMSGNTIHGCPISKIEYQRLPK